MMMDCLYSLMEQACRQIEKPDKKSKFGSMYFTLIYNVWKPLAEKTIMDQGNAYKRIQVDN